MLSPANFLNLPGLFSYDLYANIIIAQHKHNTLIYTEIQCKSLLLVLIPFDIIAKHKDQLYIYFLILDFNWSHCNSMPGGSYYAYVDRI